MKEILIGSSRGGTALHRARAALRGRPLGALAGLLPAAYALIVSCDRLISVRPTRLDPDAVTFMQIAHDMTLSNPFLGWREPLWPMLLVPPVKLFGLHPTLIRVLGVAGFVLMVVAFQRLVARLYSRTWGIVAALLLAASPWLIYQAPRGLREEASTGLVLLFVTGVIRGVGGRRLVLLAAGAGLIALLRWDTVMITVPTLVIAAVIGRQRIRHALQAGAVFVLFVAPLLITAKVRYGDPFYFSNVSAAWFRNYEFAGKPGFVTKAEFLRNGFAGERITWFQYVFHLHTPTQVMDRVANALGTIPFTATGCGFSFPDCNLHREQWPTLAFLASPSILLSWLVAVAGLVGSVLLIRRRGTWPVPLALPTSVIPATMLAGLPSMDTRYLITSLPFLAIGALECLHVGLRRRARNRRNPPATPADREAPRPDSGRTPDGTPALSVSP